MYPVLVIGGGGNFNIIQKIPKWILASLTWLFEVVEHLISQNLLPAKFYLSTGQPCQPSIQHEAHTEPATVP